MIQTSLSLALSLLLALSAPLSAYFREGAAPKGAATAAGAGAAPAAGSAVSLPGLAPAAGLNVSVAPVSAAAQAAVAAALEAASSPAALSAMALRPAAGQQENLARAILTRPDLLQTPAVRAEAELVYGAEDVARLEAAAVQIAADPAQASALALLRARQTQLSPLQVRHSLELLRRSFDELTRGYEDGAPAARPSRLPALAGRSPLFRARVFLQTAAVALAVSAGLFHAPPARAAQLVERAPAAISSPAPILLAQAAPRANKSVYIAANDIGDVVAQWTPDVHLYVVGDVGLDRGTLQKLAADLAGKHWTIVLIADSAAVDASGNPLHVFKDGQGKTHYGDQAVDFGTGTGIFKKNGFADQINAKTGQGDGTVFTVVMKQHDLMLRTSAAQNVRGFDGQKDFTSKDSKNPDKLDRWAITHLRNGIDLAGAVRETVANVDKLLDEAIESEFTRARSDIANAKTLSVVLARESASFAKSHPSAGNVGKYDAAALTANIGKAETALAGKDARGASSALAGSISQGEAALAAMKSFGQAAASTQDVLREASAAVDALAQASASFQKNHPKALGDLAKPDLDGMRKGLKDAGAQAGGNPAQGAAQARAIAAKASVSLAALNELVNNGGDRLAAAQAVLKDLQGRLRAGSAAQDLVTAKQSLAEAEQAYADGSSTFNDRLEQGKTALSSAERAIAQADASAAGKRRAAWLFALFSALATLVTGFVLNRRTRKPKAAAEELYTSWFTGLDKELDKIIDVLDQKMATYIGDESGPKSRNWVGETATLAAKVREDAGYSKILLGSARNVLDLADALIHPATRGGKIANFFWPSRYEEAVRKLKDEKVRFKPEDSESLKAAFGSKEKWNDERYGELKAYPPFEKSFNELVSEFNLRSKAAGDALAAVEKAATSHGAVLGAVEASITAVESKKAALEAPGDGLFLVPSLFSSALPAAKAALATARETVKNDPVGGLNGAGAGATRVQTDSAALIDALLEERAQTIPSITAAAGLLSKANVASAWLENALHKLSGKAESLAADVVKTSVADGLAKLRAGIGALAAEAARAAEILAEFVKGAAAAGTLTLKVAEARVEIARALGLQPEAALREPGMDPSERLTRAAAADKDGREHLGRGELDQAAAAAKAVAERVSQGNDLVDSSLASLRGHEAVQTARRAETDRIEGLVAAHEATLAEIQRRYADSVLSLGAGDPSHPKGDGTVSNNIEETNAALAQAKKDHAQALKVFRSAALLQASGLLDQVKAGQEIALHRLGEIAEKKARLDAAVAANATAVGALESRVRTYQTEIAGDRRVMKPTLAALGNAKGQVTRARAAVDAAKGDPFKAAEIIAAAAGNLDQVFNQARNDRDAYAEADRSVKAARSQLDAAASRAASARGDGIADSPAITQALGTLRSLEIEYGSLLNAIAVEHNDWNAVDRDADRLAAEAARAAATLSNEVQLAQRATDAISQASSKIREATNWTGDYGVSLPGSPGSGSVATARDALSRGDYEGAIRAAQYGYREAEQAIAAAEAEVARRYAEEQERLRRIEEERLRRQREEEERQRRQQEAEERERERQRQQEEDARQRQREAEERQSSDNGRSNSGDSNSGNGRSTW